jgi:hypothetical protein
MAGDFEHPQLAWELAKVIDPRSLSGGSDSPLARLLAIFSECPCRHETLLLMFSRLSSWL